MQHLTPNLVTGADQPGQSAAGWHAPGMVFRGVRLLAAVLLRGWLRLYGRLTVIGRHHLPAGRSFILIANHASHLDTLFLLAALPLRQLHRTFAVAAQDYFCVNPLITVFARLFVNIIPLDRDRPGRHSLDVCSELLQEPGTVLILFPEGTRGCGHEPDVFKPGIGLLAAGQSVPVVPCHVAGTDASLPKGAWIPRPKAVRLTIGKGRLFTHLPENRRSRTQVCHELRDAVMSLGRLPSAA
jgi:1-acyl-sn-glycerol-3-phosphate acyltransferase